MPALKRLLGRADSSQNAHEQQLVRAGRGWVLSELEFWAVAVVVDGAVRIHSSDRDLATLGPREVFGEMAALDPEPRAATATATQNTLLLGISGQLLYELMAEHLGVAKGVIRVLCRWVRATNR